ncbi:MAG: phosphoenolpyruvate--protein phosphotransferase [Candidatus Riflebacteria bacterium]|nr:phosphoenolpyruvate--protein phosphotransferase [Candidatus Riflebacteria bacterium]
MAEQEKVKSDSRGKKQDNGKILLIAPLSGVLMPIEQIPDPVFAQKMVGDGISIDPVSVELLAPCEGKITQVHSAKHALTIETDSGIEVMMHIGLDTVKLKGRGFSNNKKTGEQVRCGESLMTFDAEYLATNAKSLLTQIVITNSERIGSIKYFSGFVNSGKDPVIELTLAGSKKQADSETAIQKELSSQAVVSEAIVIPNPSGLHARPAAALVCIAKRYKSEIRLRRENSVANAKSVVSILALDVKNGDKVFIESEGPDAREANSVIAPALSAGLGEEIAHEPLESAKRTDLKPEVISKELSDESIFSGVSASGGLAIGVAHQLKKCNIEVQENGDGAYSERTRLFDALENGKAQIKALHDNLMATADPGKAAIFAAHIELLEDPDLIEIAESLIEKGKSAAYSWKNAFSSQASRLAEMSNELLAARANDLKDVGNRVLAIITGKCEKMPDFPDNCILIAEDLTPSDTASLDRKKVLGFCTVAGGATSHVAILARSLGIPAIAAIEARALEIPNNTMVILDGGKGFLKINPEKNEIELIKSRQLKQNEIRQKDLRSSTEKAITKDGAHIEIFANIGGTSDADELVKTGGDGVGLLRSEFLFLNRSNPPSEDEQTDIYSSIAGKLGSDRPLIIRTLDVGGDKPLSYLPIPREENPFLGERGIRVGINRPEILRTQIRAILRASSRGKILVMFPMISMLSEWRFADGMLKEEAKSLGIAPVPTGIMVEVPAAAVLSDIFAREAAFFSIGTNDLTQYTLAMDRGHPMLASKVDALNPAVLRLIAQTVDSARKYGRKVGVCGGVAGDPSAVAILLGLGVDELSVSIPVIPSVKALVRKLDLQSCRALAQKALTLDCAADVRKLVATSSEENLEN